MLGELQDMGSRLPVIALLGTFCPNECSFAQMNILRNVQNLYPAIVWWEDGDRKCYTKRSGRSEMGGRWRPFLFSINEIHRFRK